MQTIHEAEKDLEVAWNGDVLVVGGGPAGVAAAICAAREGAKTLLLEQSGNVGGVATTGLMSHWTGTTSGGIYEEIIKRSSDDLNGPLRQVINTERLKTVFLEMLLESGAQVQLYTFSSDAIVQEGRVKGIIAQSKLGRQAFMADVVIDATGDGDIAANAGAEFVLGRDDDNRMQPMTLMFKVGGVDMSEGVFPGAFEERIAIPKGEIQQLGREHLPSPAGHVLLYRSTLPGVVTCNMTNSIDVDGTNPVDLTKATVECRRQIEAISKFLREYVPGFENCYVLDSASIIGVRETRHFKGVKTITEDDIREARVPDDWAVVKAHFGFDIHNVHGAGLDEHGAQKKFKQKAGYGIPYGCLVPERMNGLLLAGRNISGTHKAHSSFRVMPIVANIGQAAGTAAALCAKEHIQPRDLPVATLQEALLDQGVRP